MRCTNERIKEGLEVSGYKGLESIMEKQHLDKLKKLVGVVKTSGARRKVESDDDEDDESISEKIKKSELQKRVVEDLYQILTTAFFIWIKVIFTTTKTVFMN